MQNESDINGMAGEDGARRWWWAVPAAAVLLLATLAMVFGKRQEPATRRTSYDASAEGFRAAYLLLEELGYPIARGKRLGGGAARLIISPYRRLDDAAKVNEWVRGGGVLILADSSGEFASKMGISLTVQTLEEDAGDVPASGAGVAVLSLGRTRAKWSGQTGEVWVKAGAQPVITSYAHGKGNIWLINCPDVFANRAMRRADNGVLLCRLTEEALRGRSGKVLFDEYFHGMRDQPGVTELLFQPPAIWVSLQALLLIGLLLWHYAPRFGGLKPSPPPSRRSKEEFLDAMAALLDRKRDYADAYRTVRDGLVRDIEHELGRPAGMPVEQLAREAAWRLRRHRLESEAGTFSAERLLHLLTAEAPPDGRGSAGFLKALNELETLRDEFFRKQRH